MSEMGMTTNENKAKELTQKTSPEVPVKSAVFASSMDMAEWKDEQFQEERKQWIEKAIDLIEDNIDKYLFINRDWMEAQIDSMEFIKFFKKEMEE